MNSEEISEFSRDSLTNDVLLYAFLSFEFQQNIAINALSLAHT